MVKEIKKTSKNTAEFVKRLVNVVLAITVMLPVASAIYSVVYVQKNVTDFAQYTIIFSSIVGGLAGLIWLYKLLMQQAAK